MNPIDLFVVAGQSNARGKGTSADAPAVDPDLGLMWNGTAIVALADPVGGAVTGSAWPAFTNAVTAITGRPLCVVGCAVDSSALREYAAYPDNNWSTTGDNYALATAKVGAAVTALEGGGWDPTLRGVLWAQGESDAGQGSGLSHQNAYSAALIELHDRFTTDLGPHRFFVWQTGHPDSGDTAGYLTIRTAQDDACGILNPRLVMAYTGCQNFPALGYMKDELHYDQDGLNLMGTEGGKVVARYLPNLNPPAAVTAAGGALTSHGGALTFA